MPAAAALLELVAPAVVAADAADTVLEVLLNPLDPLNWRRRLAEAPRTTPDKVSISFRRGQGLKNKQN